jgi:hypothetical protein
LDKGDNLFVAIDRAADDSRLQDRPMRIQNSIDFCRIDIEPGPNDQLLDSPDDEQVLPIETHEPGNRMLLMTRSSGALHRRVPEL